MPKVVSLRAAGRPAACRSCSLRPLISSAVKRDRRDAHPFARELERQARFEACNHAGLDLGRAFRWPSPARARRGRGPGHARPPMAAAPALALAALHAWGGAAPVSGRGISQLLTGRAVVLIATGRPVGRHAWGLPAWRGRVGIRAAAGAVCGGCGLRTHSAARNRFGRADFTRVCALHCPSLGHRRRGHGLAPAPPTPTKFRPPQNPTGGSTRSLTTGNAWAPSGLVDSSTLRL